MSWASLFERADEFDADLEGIREHLQERREQQTDG
jgi:hypothetical protein